MKRGHRPVYDLIAAMPVVLTACFFGFSFLAHHATQDCEIVLPIFLCAYKDQFEFGWFDTYQTFIAAMLALAGAGWSVAAINRQIRQDWEFEHESRESKRAAARSVLPLALSAVSEYAEECAHLLTDLIDKCVGGALPTAARPPDLPALPLDALDAIKEMTEYALPSERQVLATLVAKVQVQRARLLGVTSARAGRGPTMILDLNLNRYLADSAEIHVRAGALFSFARNAVAVIGQHDIGADEIVTALKLTTNFDDDDMSSTLRGVIETAYGPIGDQG
ncbi:conserved hypothetical protein [Mesorhizobium plurifarium]|uniref:Uncharacterized protein n=1 Tax=Mesorhizobium plurifarium TaxID=69974 RepID=A0A090F4H7_MESPL|nr:conserved hypothetical protein [Mesorhizobium plurifarium]CDX38822.1 conserved hypothetical protein [Mesorhizobium sp. SOD10]